ncbi:uncharacterized protein LY89DRAFT_723112 [Mollisia scopiformis]|uniref:Apple domain-containing protein n=1 Tax=Mollisia scopiformis TaxID=149040 RepID=A0A194WTK6_MOLSC|nr:uncharacterized protein LY89DRAFT_723112 [Mollisia scopiformis]KUJ11293.1 hypothetical protein LY89DRAFT_723112 [Mollisia scopiformis]
MRFLLSLLALSVEAGLVLGKPYARNGIIYDETPEPLKARHEVRDLGAEESILDIVASCGNSYNLFTTGTGPVPTGKPDPNFDYLSFCCAFNQPTKTLTSISYYPTTVTLAGTPSTVTAVTTSTATLAGSGTATATCPIPAPSMICGQGGWGYATNNIYSKSGIDAIACHELCLANSACQSFQVETNSSTTTPTCNLYKVDPSGNNTIASPAAPFSFFARDCPDHIPAACSNAGIQVPPIVIVPPPSASTTAPIVIVTPPAFNPDTVIITPTRIPGPVVTERAEQWATIPWFLQPFGTATLSEVCSCIYTHNIPATTVLGVLPKATTIYLALPGTIVTAFVTTVVTIGGGQPVTSIA